MIKNSGALTNLHLYKNQNKDYEGNKLLTVKKNNHTVDCFFYIFLFKKPKRKKVYHNPIEVDAVQGCLMIFDSKVFNKIGGFQFISSTIIVYICQDFKKSGF